MAGNCPPQTEALTEETKQNLLGLGSLHLLHTGWLHATRCKQSDGPYRSAVGLPRTRRPRLYATAHAHWARRQEVLVSDRNRDTCDE